MNTQHKVFTTHPQTRAAEGNARDSKSNKQLVSVKFLLPNCFCQFNERLRIVGSGANTGLWTADAAPEEVLEGLLFWWHTVCGTVVLCMGMHMGASLCCW